MARELLCVCACVFPGEAIAETPALLQQMEAEKKQAEEAKQQQEAQRIAEEKGQHDAAANLLTLASAMAAPPPLPGIPADDNVSKVWRDALKRARFLLLTALQADADEQPQPQQPQPQV
jgi:hypothetical protein